MTVWIRVLDELELIINVNQGLIQSTALASCQLPRFELTWIILNRHGAYLDLSKLSQIYLVFLLALLRALQKVFCT